MGWLLLILSLPTENATTRMRAWRALKACGSVVLRDGVYLLPEHDACRSALNTVAVDVQSDGGTAHLLRVAADEHTNFSALFDRREAYAALLRDIMNAHDTLTVARAFDVLKQVRRLRKAFINLCHIDYFPGEAQKQTEAALQALETQANRLLTPDEPHAVDAAIPRLRASDYRGRRWATRRRPWVDRLASAWLIRRAIDPDARFLWLRSPGECPPDALGFDFDGAAFSHVGAKVTFELLLASFGLEHPALKRLGALVHYLDVGGVQPIEASGVERVLAGLRESITDDDRLLEAASRVFDGLRVAFETETAFP